MTFPTKDITATPYTTGANENTKDVAYPAHSAGDRLQLWACLDDSSTGISSITDVGTKSWSSVGSASDATTGNGQAMFVYELLDSDGDASPGTVTVTLAASASETGGLWIIAVSGDDSTQAAEITIAGTGSQTTSPDPGSLSPSWGAEDNLWITGVGWGGDAPDVDPGGYPTNYTDGTQVKATTSGQGAGFAVAFRELNAASEDPGAFSMDTNVGYVTATVAIKPESSVLVDKTGVGGVVVGGAADVLDLTAEQVTGAGGVVVGGAADILNPAIKEVTGAGGAKVGGSADVIFFGGPSVDSDIVVEWDFDNDGDFDESVEDITEFVLSLETQLGRDFPSQLTGKAGPGQLRATLRNDDDRFNFYNTSSPVNSGNFSLKTGRKIRVRTSDAANPDPTLLAQDRFPRATGPVGVLEVGGTWSVELGTFGLTDRELRPNSEGVTSIMVVDVGTTDYLAQVKVLTLGFPNKESDDNINIVGLVYRYQDTNDYSLLVLQSDLSGGIGAQTGTLSLIDVVGGVETTVDSANVEILEDMTIAALVEGSSVTGYLEGVELVSGTAIQTDETEVGIYAFWDDGAPQPFLDDFYVWDGLPTQQDGIIWTGEISDIDSSVEAGPLKLAQITAEGVLSNAATQDVESAKTISGMKTGLLVGQTLVMANLEKPGIPLDEGVLTTGPSYYGRINALEAARRYEEAEFGFLYETNEGYVGFDDRNARSGSISQVTFSDQAVFTNKYSYFRIVPHDWRREIFNRVIGKTSPQPIQSTSSAQSNDPINVNNPVSITMPSTVDAGDLLMVVVSVNPDHATVSDIPQPLLPVGWTELSGVPFDDETLEEWDPIRATPAAYVKVAEGDEDSTSVVFSRAPNIGSGTTTGNWAACVARYTDWYGEVQGGVAISKVPFGSGVTKSSEPCFVPWGIDAISRFRAFRGSGGGGAGNTGSSAFAPDGYHDVFANHADDVDHEAVLQWATRDDFKELEEPGPWGGGTDDDGFNSGWETAPQFVIAVRSADGAEFQFDNVESQDDHGGIKTFSHVGDLFASESDADTWADLILDQHASDRPIIEISFYASKYAAMRVQAIQRRISDRITVVADNQAGLGINQDFYIESINHQWSNGTKLWITTWQLSPVPS